MVMSMPYALGAPLMTLALGEALSETHVPYGYYAAVGGTLVGIALVVKGWEWVRHQWRDDLKTAFREHNARDQERWDAARREFGQAVELLTSRSASKKPHTDADSGRDGEQ